MQNTAAALLLFLLLLAILSLNSCVTRTDSHGTRITRPDADTIAILGEFSKMLLPQDAPPRAKPVHQHQRPNPLDFPGERPATAAELHAGNLAEITGNPAYQPR